MRRILFAAWAPALGLCAFASFAPAAPPAPGKVGVVVSILPLAYFAERVGGGAVEVSVMIPPGGNPHTYEPTPRQLAGLSRAKLYVEAGSGLEFELAWMEKVAALNPGMRICDASRGIALAELGGPGGRSDEGNAPGARRAGGAGPEDESPGGARIRRRGKDPHIWLSPANAAVIADNIRDALAAVDPGRAEAYAANARALKAELDTLDGEIREALAPVRGRGFIVFHPAWGYFAARYGLAQVAIEAGGKEPTGRELAAVVSGARRLGAKAVFASPEFSRKAAETIAAEIGGRVVLIDALARDYPDNLRRVARAVAEGAR